MKRIGILTRTILLTSFASLFTDIASEMLYPVTPLFLSSIGFSMLGIGFLEGIVEGISGFSKGYFGSLSDRLEIRARFIQAGYFLSAFSKPLIGFFPTIPGVFAGRALDRIGKGIRTAPRDALLADESTPENRGKVFGFHRAMDTCGAAVGPALALLYLKYHPGDYVALYFIAFIPGILGSLSTLLIREGSHSATTPSARGGSFARLMSFWPKAPSSYKKLVICFVLFAFFNASDVFILLKGKSTGLSDSGVIGAYIFYNVCYAVLSFPAGVAADRFGFSRVYGGSLLIFSLVYGLLGMGVSGAYFWCTLGLYGLYAAANEGISKAWVSLCLPADARGTGIGLFQMLSTFAVIAASPLAGALWQLFGAAVPFFASSFFALLLGVYFLISFDSGDMASAGKAEFIKD